MRRVLLEVMAGAALLLASVACSRTTPATGAGSGSAPAAAAAPASVAAAASAPAPAAVPAPETPHPPAPLLYEARLGKELYAHYCQTCHGDTGAGDGFNAFNLDPHPRDLSDPEFQRKKSADDLRDTIRRGGSGVGLSPLMPPWGRTLTGRQIDAVVLYLRTLRRTGS